MLLANEVLVETVLLLAKGKREEEGKDDRHESRDLKCSCRCSEGGFLAVGVTKDDAGIG